MKNCYKYAGYLDWHISPHADRSKLHTCQGVSLCQHELTKFFSLFGLGV